MEKLDLSKLNSPEDIPIGTILVQHWCNSSTFFKVVGTSKKSVAVVRMPDKQTRFEHEGGGTGYRYILPDEEALQRIEKAYKDCCDEYGFDVLSKKATEQDFQNAKAQAVSNRKCFWDDYAVISNNRDCLITKRIMTKPSKDGGFYIPGAFRGSFCGPMLLWSGEEVAEYYS